MTNLWRPTRPSMDRPTRRRRSRKCLALALFWLVALTSAVRPVMAADPPKTVIPSFQGFRAKVVGDVCNLRTGPGTSYARTGQVSQGQWLDILGAKDGWYLVRYNNKETYIAAAIDIDLESGRLTPESQDDVGERESQLDSRVKFITQKVRLPAVAKGSGLRSLSAMTQAGLWTCWLSIGLCQAI